MRQARMGFLSGDMTVVVATLAYLLALVVVLVWRARPPAALDPAGTVLSILGVVALVFAYFWAYRRGVFRIVARSHGATSERRRALAQIRGRRPVDDEALPTLVPVAERLRIQRALLPAYAGMELGVAGTVMRQNHMRWLDVAILLIGTTLWAGIVLVARDARRADVFLIRHRAERPEGGHEDVRPGDAG